MRLSGQVGVAICPLQLEGDVGKNNFDDNYSVKFASAKNRTASSKKEEKRGTNKDGGIFLTNKFNIDLNPSEKHVTTLPSLDQICHGRPILDPYILLQLMYRNVRDNFYT